MLGWICACAFNSWKDYSNQLILLCRKSHLFCIIKRSAWIDTQGPLKCQRLAWRVSTVVVILFETAMKEWNLPENSRETSRFDKVWKMRTILSFKKIIGEFTMLGMAQSRVSPNFSRPVVKLQKSATCHRSQIKTLKPCSVLYKKSPRRPLEKWGFFYPWDRPKRGGLS